jgi:hypothetical protein
MRLPAGDELRPPYLVFDPIILFPHVPVSVGASP